MSDQIFRYAGTSAAPYGDPFVVRDEWLPRLKEMWISALILSNYGPQLAPWIPTFESGQVSWPGNDGSIQTLPMNKFFLVTRETAEKLAEIFSIEKGHPLVIVEQPFFNAIQRFLKFPNGRTVACNQLAQYYYNNPEDKFPGLALHLSLMLISQVWPT